LICMLGMPTAFVGGSRFIVNLWSAFILCFCFLPWKMHHFCENRKYKSQFWIEITRIEWSQTSQLAQCCVLDYIYLCSCIHSVCYLIVRVRLAIDWLVLCTKTTFQTFVSTSASTF
jgi:hypothetical protein